MDSFFFFFPNRLASGVLSLSFLDFFSGSVGLDDKWFPPWLCARYEEFTPFDFIMLNRSSGAKSRVKCSLAVLSAGIVGGPSSGRVA